MAVAYLPLLRLLYSIRADERKSKEAAKKHAERIVEGANEQAMEIIEGARLQAREILKKAGGVTADSDEILKSALGEVSQRSTQALAKTFELTQSEALETLTNISKDIKEEAANEIKKMRETMEKESLAAKEEADREVAAYKETKMKKTDEEIGRMVEEVATAVLGKGVSLENQEELISAALEEAKKRANA